jgi:predicted membrane-bound spermidine synthase
MRRWLFATVFVSGFTSLAVEMAASRLLGNYFGASNLTWASIIGLILIYLTVGYFLGGRWADRSPHFNTFFQILIWGSFAVGLVPIVSRPILRFAAAAFDDLQFGALIGSFAAVLVLFCIPITLLGTASPFAIRLAIQDSRQAGRISGQIYAISTLGSFLGTFFPVLILIPLVGTYRTFLAISALLLCTAIAGLGFTAGWRKALPFFILPVVVAVLYVLGVRGADKNTPGLIYEKDSPYNYVQVQQVDQALLLRLNDGQGYHSIYHPEILFFNGPWEQVLVAPFFNAAPVDPESIRNMAIVGLAAGTTAYQATAVFPNIQIDGIEIDPVIVEVGRKYFHMTMPNLNVIVQDGRVALAQSDQKYQVISVDAYRPPYIPWHLTTVEFFQIVRDHLTEDGVMVINVGRSPRDRRLVDALASTCLAVFPSVHIMDLPDSFNSILFATMLPTSPENLIDNFYFLERSGKAPDLLLQSMGSTLANLQAAPEPGPVFTDDLAPIEWITNSMVINFLLSGGAERIQ